MQHQRQAAHELNGLKFCYALPHKSLIMRAIATKQINQNTTGAAAPLNLSGPNSTSIGPAAILRTSTTNRAAIADIGRPYYRGKVLLCNGKPSLIFEASPEHERECRHSQQCRRTYGAPCHHNPKTVFGLWGWRLRTLSHARVPAAQQSSNVMNSRRFIRSPRRRSAENRA